MAENMTCSAGGGQHSMGKLCRQQRSAMIRDILTAIAALLANPTPITAPVVPPGTHQFGNVIYTLPADWRLGNDADGVQIILSDLPDDVCEYCYIYISAGFPAEGSLTDFLRSKQGVFVDEEDRPGIEVMAEPDLLQASGHDAAMMAIKADSDFQMLLAIDLGDRYELLAFEGYGYDQEELTEGMEVLSNQVSPMFDSLQFVSAGAPSLLPTPVPGDLSGMYWGISTGYTMGLDLMMQFEVYNHYYFFWPDGQFYDGTPPAGLQPLDRAALLAAGDVSFGVYRHAKNDLILTYANGDTKTLTASGADWAYDDIVLSPTPLMPDGSRFSGTISSFFYSGFTPGSGVEGGVSSSSSTTFYPDGTYTGSSFGGAFGSFDQGGGFSTGSEGADGGTYEIRDGLIISTPADGSGPRAEVIFDTSEGIVIGGQYIE
jgi:hypothetical protein